MEGEVGGVCSPKEVRKASLHSTRSGMRRWGRGRDMMVMTRAMAVTFSLLKKGFRNMERVKARKNPRCLVSISDISMSLLFSIYSNGFRCDVLTHI